MRLSNPTGAPVAAGPYTIPAGVSAFYVADVDYTTSAAVKAAVDLALAAGTLTVSEAPDGWISSGGLLVPSGRVEAMPVGGLQFGWRDEFPGAALNAANWTQRAIGGGGGSAAVAGSNLTLATGTVSGGGIELVSGAFLRPPCRLVIVLSSISQRIANQELEIGFVRADAAIDAVNVDLASFIFNGVSATAVDLRTNSQGDTGTISAATAATTASQASYEIDLTTDEVWFYSGGAPNISGSLKTNGNRVMVKAPDPAALYRIRLRVKNTGVPASSTNLVIDSVLVEDYTQFSLELARSRGSQFQGEQFPVNVAAIAASSGPPAISSPRAIWWDDTGANLGISATYIGASRDLMGVAQNAVTGVTTSAYPARFRGWATADQPGQLFYVASRDNANWYRVAAFPTAVLGARNVARFDEPVVSRYARVEYDNSAAAQTSFVLGTQAVAIS